MSPTLPRGLRTPLVRAHRTGLLLPAALLIAMLASGAPVAGQLLGAGGGDASASGRATLGPDGEPFFELPGVDTTFVPNADVRIDGDVGPGVSSSTLPQIVGTDLDGGGFDMLHVVWQDYRDTGWEVYYRRLSPGGLPQLPLERSLSAVPQLNATVPKIATDGSEALYVVWHAAGNGTVPERILFVRSDDAGLTWSLPGLAAGKQLNVGIETDYASEPHIVADDSGHVHVAWSQSDGVTDQVFAASSSDRGATWTPPTRINVLGSAHSQDARIAADGNGNVFVMYLDRRDPERHEVFLNRSTDDGLTWGPDILVSATGSAAYPSIVAHASGLLLAAWVSISIDGPTGLLSTKLVSNASIDAGLTFRGEETVSRRCPTVPPWIDGEPGCESLPGPLFLDLDLATDDAGNVWCSYGRVSAPLIGRPSLVFANVFDRDALAWGKETLLSPQLAPYPVKGVLPMATRTQITTDGNNAFAVWMQTATGFQTHADIEAAWSSNGGVTWSAPTSVTTKPDGPGSSRSAYPQVVAEKERAVVVWDDRRAWTRLQDLDPLDPTAPAGAPDIYLNIITLVGPVDG